MDYPIVNTTQGRLKGKCAIDHFGGKYYSFQGIPYAKPPLGELRFKAPQPATPWSGIRDATSEGPPCFAHHYIFRKEIIGSEDCLYLNIYSPNLSNGLKPVMFWIHGGGYKDGSSSSEVFGPDFLVSADVVVVTINYRLGALGFLSLEDTSLGVPGNAGLKDMVMALKWVQKNINFFMGDPDNVTIFGESAGGASCHYLLLSPLSKGLFHKVIAQSGVSINNWVSGSRCAHRLAEKLGFTDNTDEKVLEFLQKVPVEQIIYAQDQMPDKNFPAIIRDHGPIVEKPSPEAFLTESPMDIIRSGNYIKVPMMMGYCNREGILFTRLERNKPSNFELFVPKHLGLSRGSVISKRLADKIKKFYFGDEEYTDETIENYCTLRTDVFMLVDIIRAIRAHLDTSKMPIYFYRFSAETDLNFSRKFSDGLKGAGHCDEVDYIFKSGLSPDIVPNSPEEVAVKRMVKLWTNFARFGDPNPAEIDALINVMWKPVEKGRLHFMDIGEELKADVNPEAGRIAFWDDLFKSVPYWSRL